MGLRRSQDAKGGNEESDDRRRDRQEEFPRPAGIGAQVGRRGARTEVHALHGAGRQSVSVVLSAIEMIAAHGLPGTAPATNGGRSDEEAKDQ